MLHKMISTLLLSLCLISTVHAEPENNANTQALSQYQHALNFLLGRNGHHKSPAKAAQIFKTLAEQNWRSAQHMLGNLYFKGKGVEKNDLLAYKWLSIASRDNLNLAKSLLEKRHILQKRLSGKRLQQAEQWIENWQPGGSQALTANNP